jgi:hypothetical protein
LIIGGTAVGSVIQYKGTSGNGTSTVAAHQFLVGNNGATPALSITNANEFLIHGNAIYLAKSVVTSTNHSFYGTALNTYMNAYTASGTLNLTVNTNLRQYYNDYQSKYTGAVFSGSLGTDGVYMITPGAAINLSAGVEINMFKIPSFTWTWNTGALATQKFNVIKSPTLAFNGASTATDVYGLYVEAATAGTNAIITNNYAAGFGGNIKIDAATANVFIGTTGSFIRDTSGVLRVSSSNSSNLELAYNATSVKMTIGSAGVSVTDSVDLVFGTINGTKIGTATTQKLSFWNATPIVQPTTAVTSSTIVGGAGTTVKEDHTFDGYTIGQVVKALRNAGLLA